MKKQLIMVLSAAMSLAVFSCNKHDNNSTTPAKQFKTLQVTYENADELDLAAEEDTSAEINPTGRSEKIATNTVFFEEKAEAGNIKNVYNIKYWLFPANATPDLAALKANTYLYTHPTGIIKKKGQKLVGSKKLATGKTFVFEGDGGSPLVSFKNDCADDKCKHFVGMGEQGATKFTPGYVDSVGTVKVSNNWGLYQGTQTYKIAWYELAKHGAGTVTPATIAASKTPFDDADGSVTINNAQGSGAKLYESFKLPTGDYIFYYEDNAKNATISEVTLTVKKAAYLKFEVNQ